MIITELTDFSSSFRKLVESSNNTAEVERKIKTPLSSGQQRILDEYYSQRQKQQERRPLTKKQVATFRYRNKHPRIKFTFDKNHNLRLRNPSGKFVSIPEYLKTVYGRGKKKR